MTCKHAHDTARKCLFLLVSKCFPHSLSLAFSAPCRYHPVSNIHWDSSKRIQAQQQSKMTAAENICYTLINVTSDSEPPSEVTLKTDLGRHY